MARQCTSALRTLKMLRLATCTSPRPDRPSSSPTRRLLHLLLLLLLPPLHLRQVLSVRTKTSRTRPCRGACACRPTTTSRSLLCSAYLPRQTRPLILLSRSCFAASSAQTIRALLPQEVIALARLTAAHLPTHLPTLHHRTGPMDPVSCATRLESLASLESRPTGPLALIIKRHN